LIGVKELRRGWRVIAGRIYECGRSQALAGPAQARSDQWWATSEARRSSTSLIASMWLKLLATLALFNLHQAFYITAGLR
jgi:hypothetical protein